MATDKQHVVRLQLSPSLEGSDEHSIIKEYDAEIVEDYLLEIEALEVVPADGLQKVDIIKGLR